MSAKKLAKNKVKKETKSKKNPTQKDDFLVVGIGASAGGLEAFKEFFTNMPDDSGLAFILVQHLDPTHKSMLTDLIGNYSNMKVSQVEDGTKVEPNHIYIIPPNKYMGILGGVLQLLEPQDDRGHRRPIDFFFKSLSKDQKEKAIGIVFSGTGTEGTLGLKMIKAEGGLSIVQDPETAKYDGMPKSAVKSSAADLILPVAKIPDQLAKYKQNRIIAPEEIISKIVPQNNDLEKVFILLRNATNCNFNDYKSSTVVRRIERRMIIHQIVNLQEYVKYLQKNPEEVMNLFKDLLIGVTQFFRDKDSIEQLQKKSITQIVKQKKTGDIVRMWIPACSTGEEAFTFAILFDEVIRKLKKDIRIQIFASDIDEEAINYARIGLYSKTIAQDISPIRLKKYFLAETHAYRIKKEIRDQIIFAEQNLINDPPFSKLDLISCRNLLIYLNPKAQQKVFSIFHYSLNPDGILFLGNSESLGESADLFSTTDRKHKIFKRKNVARERSSEVGFMTDDIINIQKEPLTTPQRKLHRNNLKQITEKLLIEKYAPACAVINLQGDAVYFSGNTGKYLEPAAGEATLNIVEMARDGLKNDLRTAIAKVIRKKMPEARYGLKLRLDDKIQTIDLNVIPITELDPNSFYLMITFSDQQDDTVAIKTKGKPKEIDSPSEIYALEQELTSTKEYLRTTIEELEVSNEEMKSTNEELQSANEELQSSNEELETSKEELQSVNEEMVTVNSELQDKIDELDHAYNDINNLLTSTDIATIFLDNELVIRRYTEAISNIVNLIDADIGRSISHLSFNLEYDNLISDIQEVLDKLIPIRKIIKTKDGKWYQMQVVPYRTSENMIDGAVVTFVDVTEEKKVQEEIAISKERFEGLLAHTKTIISKQDKKLKYTDMVNSNPKFSLEDVIGKTDKELLENEEEAIILEKIKKKVIRTGKAIREEIKVTLNKKVTYYDLVVHPLIDADKKKVGIVCTATDISDIKELGNKLQNKKN